MKKKHFFMMLLLGFFCLSFSTAYAQRGTPLKANEAQVTFSVEIDCPSCQKKLESRLPFERGVKDMKVDFDKNEVWILYQINRTDKEKLIEAIKKLGLKATEKEKPVE